MAGTVSDPMSLSRGAWEALRRLDGQDVSEESWWRYRAAEEHKRAQKLASVNDRLRKSLESKRGGAG